MTQAEKLGQKIVELFDLPKLRDKSKQYGKNYYMTTWGDKTLEGLGKCIFRLVKENEYNIDEKCTECGKINCYRSCSGMKEG